ncbi:hypothetical protein E8E15_007204 [Penicillium rubens]|uniref:Vacuolar fusion protein CCZ1-like protein n=1 Tax=Penicillium chrysogenum TaxID=5076 RepID=A0A167V6M2_PENCH|nr:uncharacterized protein N7525_000192 [Penicillium rubens]KZN90069.1 Vacuolar fusion protein CCZ1-like protein [Penicillium chrysogenum]KAF3024539.1 hypothetical protein E8E15_007204 [Penicillium rubens]KAJ5040042.1 hypothetical protein NUH16_009842 [Penicillium rubens]KAJ5842451.1 hypothetical protein N7525_000192 [Penicillium rubens]KAJ5846976.1 hypothetical protein N7534_010645 [Penicillium rubens]
MPGSDHDSVIPAQLSYLAIYNPTLGPTDETLADQIVFYTSKSSCARRIDGSTTEGEANKCLEDEGNERLRQIGLAQGMVNFASNFSAGKTLEYVETDKARVVLLELEKDWWIVASIDLTRIPADQGQRTSGASDSPAFYYSSREMGPPPLLIQQLRRAHSEFLLHHDFKLDSLLDQVGRSTFCLFLERYWEKFAWNWELLLTGNPIVDIYNGIKLSAGGELGIGVGEEEWGSGEREVLEDFVTRTDGLVDLAVSRFGDEGSPALAGSNDESRWLGADNDPRPSDGVIFTGVGALSRHSLAQVSHWMQCIYRFGDAAYGVGRDPTSLRRRKPRKQRGRQISEDAPQPSTPARSFTPGIPRPLVTAAPQPSPEVVEQNQAGTRNEASPLRTEQNSENPGFPTETVMKYLTLGYGSSWSFSPKSTSTPPESSTPMRDESNSYMSTPRNRPTSAAQSSQAGINHRNSKRNSPSGHFVLGPRDDLETLDDLEEGSPEPESENGKPNTRIVHRTLHVHLAEGSDATPTRLRVVIYVHQPFMFAFLFDPETPALSSPSLYSSIHHQLGPLQKPLLSSTSPTTAASRIAMSETSPDPNKRFSTRTQPVYDLVYDPSNLTIRSSIPNIPSMDITSPSTHLTNSPARSPSPSPSQASTPPPWSRVESLAIHHRLLSTHADTRSRPQELERTSKTHRGWWVLWVRIPHSTAQTPTALSATSSSAALSSIANNDDSFPASQSQTHSTPPPQEAFLVRKASDYISPASQGRVSSGARFFRDLGGASSSTGLAGPSRATDMAPSKLVEGLGMDARRYIEGLLSLNR